MACGGPVSNGNTVPMSAPLANSMANIKRSARSISLGVNRLEQNTALHAASLADAGKRPDIKATSRPASPRGEPHIPKLNFNANANTHSLQTQAQDDSEDSSEMYRSYALANIDINLLYTSPLQIKKDAELASELLSPRGPGIDTSDFFGEDCYGVVSWKGNAEKVSLHYEGREKALERERTLEREKTQEREQRPAERDRERVAPSPVTSVMKEEESKSSMRWHVTFLALTC